MKLLIRFRHGLGDAVQLTTVLAHLRHYQPDWEVDVAALAGKQSVFRGQCNAVSIRDKTEPPQAEYDRVLDLGWPEPHGVRDFVPSTKAERCLQDVFGLRPLRELCKYCLDPGAEAVEAAKMYLEPLAAVDPVSGRYKVVIIHYQGNTAQERKNLSHDAAKAICDQVRDHGYVPVILDWDRRSPIPDDREVYCPRAGHWLWSPAPGTGDGERIAALIGQSALFVGIDSGPQKIAGATGTPTIAVWTRQHPVHYYGLNRNALHLVPEDHSRYIRGDRDAGEKLFAELYRAEVYRNMTVGLCSAVHAALVGGPMDEQTLARSSAAIGQGASVHGYSQYGEDEWIIRHLTLPPRGVFVEVGVSHPSVHSNSLAFEEMGWEGILIEPDPRTQDFIEANRRAPLFRCAAGMHDGVVDFTLEKDPTLSGIRRSGGLSVSVTIRKLNSILDEAGVNVIDVLSIDTEGTELDVWVALDKRKHKPGVVIIEYSTKGLPDNALPILRQLTFDGYAMVHVTDANFIFVKAETRS